MPQPDFKLSANKQKVYDSLRELGADCGTPQEFDNYLKASYANRHSVWEALRDAGGDTGTYDEFHTWLRTTTKPKKSGPAQTQASAKQVAGGGAKAGGQRGAVSGGVGVGLVGAKAMGVDARPKQERKATVAGGGAKAIGVDARGRLAYLNTIPKKAEPVKQEEYVPDAKQVEENRRQSGANGGFWEAMEQGFNSPQARTRQAMVGGTPYGKDGDYVNNGSSGVPPLGSKAGGTPAHPGSANRVMPGDSPKVVQEKVRRQQEALADAVKRREMRALGYRIDDTTPLPDDIKGMNAKEFRAWTEEFAKSQRNLRLDVYTNQSSVLSPAERALAEQNADGFAAQNERLKVEDTEARLEEDKQYRWGVTREVDKVFAPIEESWTEKYNEKLRENMGKVTGPSGLDDPYNNVVAQTNKEVNASLNATIETVKALQDKWKQEGKSEEEIEYRTSVALQDIENRMVAAKLPKNAFEYIVRGLEDTFIGTLGKMAASTEYDLYLDGVANKMAAEDAGFWANVGRGVVSIIGDTPVFGVAGKAGGVATNAAMKAFVKRATSNLVKRGVSRAVAERAAERYITTKLGQRLAAGTVGNMVTMGTYEGMVSAPRTATTPAVLSDGRSADLVEAQIKAGLVEDKDGTLQKEIKAAKNRPYLKNVLRDFRHGMVTGATMIGAPLMQKLTYGRGAMAKLMGEIGGVNINAATMTLGGGVMEGNFDDFFEKYLENAATFTLLHGQGKLGALAHPIKAYREAQARGEVERRYGFSKADLQDLKDRGYDGLMDRFVDLFGGEIPTKQDGVGRSLTEAEATSSLESAQAHAEKMPVKELTRENWDAEFPDGKVQTPMGEVKLGEHQYEKLQGKGRENEFGMIKPTLERPDFVIEEGSEASEGQKTERPTSLLYVKSFIGADGKKHYFFKSVTVQKEGMEVNVSNYIDRPDRVREALKKGKLLWKRSELASGSSDVNQGLYNLPEMRPNLTSEGRVHPQSNSTEGKGKEEYANAQGKIGGFFSRWQDRVEKALRGKSAEERQLAEAAVRGSLERLANDYREGKISQEELMKWSYLLDGRVGELSEVVRTDVVAEKNADGSERYYVREINKDGLIVRQRRAGSEAEARAVQARVNRDKIVRSTIAYEEDIAEGMEDEIYDQMYNRYVSLLFVPETLLGPRNKAFMELYKKAGEVSQTLAKGEELTEEEQKTLFDYLKAFGEAQEKNIEKRRADAGVDDDVLKSLAGMSREEAEVRAKMLSEQGAHNDSVTGRESTPTGSGDSSATLNPGKNPGLTENSPSGNAVETRKVEVVELGNGKFTTSADLERIQAYERGLRNELEGRQAVETEGEDANNGNGSINRQNPYSGRIRNWLSEENLEWAEGKTREEIIEHFGNELEAIATLPSGYLKHLGGNGTDNRVYSGMGYFIDHAVNHHDEEPVEEYLKIQEILNSPDDVKLDNSKGRPTLLFIKKYDKYYVEMVSVGDDGTGRIVLHKSFFHRRKMPHKGLPSVALEESSVDEVPTISPSSKQDEAGSSAFSALDDIGEGNGLSEDGKIKLQESARQIDGITNKETGQIVPVRMRLDGSEGYVVSGRVVMTADGLVDKEQSDKVLFVRMADGETKQVDIDAIGEFGPMTDAEEAKAAARAEIEAQEQEATENDAPSYEVAQQLRVVVDGEEREATVVDVNDDGTVTVVIVGEGGERTIDASELRKMEIRDDDDDQGGGAPPPMGGAAPKVEKEKDGNNGNDSSIVGRSLTTDEATSAISEMELHAAVAPEIELTIENWDAEFGSDGRVNTPIGEVKMGENQFVKLMRQGRNGKLGMIKPTLENPDVIIEEASEAKEGDEAERKSSYIFVKAFQKADGSRYYYFTSVTVSKDGREVVISSQEKSRNRVVRLMTEGKILWRTPKDATTASVEQQGLDYVQPSETETATKGSGMTPQSSPSEGKGSVVGGNEQEISEENVPIDLTGANMPDTAEIGADEAKRKAQGSEGKGKQSYQLSDEVDENGRQFVLAPNGHIEFGEIGEESGLTPAPILLSEGIITDPITNAGYGLVHIEARHGDQIRAAGYNSVLEFIEEVAKNYEVIREGRLRDGLQTYMLQLTDKHNNTLMVELSGDGTYWNINTAGIFKTSYGAKRNVVYNRHTTDKQSAETVEASLSGEQSGTTPSTRMNTPTQPSADVTGKGKENVANEQGKDGRNESNDVLSAEERARENELKARFKNGEFDTLSPEYHELMSLDRKERILREGTGFDEFFGLKGPREIASMEDVEANVNRILQVLKDKEGEDLDYFNGYLYDGKGGRTAYARNASEQINGYLYSLTGIGKGEILQAWAKGHGFKTWEDAKAHYKKAYEKAEKTESGADKEAYKEAAYKELVDAIVARKESGVDDILDDRSIGDLYRQYRLQYGDIEDLSSYREDVRRVWQEAYDKARAAFEKVDLSRDMANVDDKMLEGNIRLWENAKDADRYADEKIASYLTGDYKKPDINQPLSRSVIEDEAQIFAKSDIALQAAKEELLRRNGESKTVEAEEPQTDKQGNPVDKDGKLIVDKLESIDELTDEDFSNPTRNVELPKIPENVDKAIGAGGKPVIIKRNILLKNKNNHPELSAEESRNVLNKALYQTNLYGKTQPISRPDYTVVIHTADKNAVVVLDVYAGKDNVEIVGWRSIDASGLEHLKRQAEREDGQLLILSPENGSAADLSTLPSEMSESKDNANSENSKGNDPIGSEEMLATRYPAYHGLSTEGRERARKVRDLAEALQDAREEVDRIQRERQALIDECDAREEAGEAFDASEYEKKQKGLARQFDKAVDAKYEASKAFDKGLKGLSDEELAGLDDLAGLAEKENADLHDDIRREHNRRIEAKAARDAAQAGFEETMRVQKVKPVAMKPRVLNADGFTSKEAVRIALNGVYHDATGFGVVSDGHLLLASKSLYDKKQKGNMVLTHKVGTQAKGSVLRDVKYPQWQRVVSESEKKVEVDFDELGAFVNGIEEQLKAEWKEKKAKGVQVGSFDKWSDQTFVELRMPDGEVVGIKLRELRSFVEGAKHLGAKELEWFDGTRPIATRTDKGVALVMPVFKESSAYTAAEKGYRMFAYDFMGDDVRFREDELSKSSDAELDSAYMKALDVVEKPKRIEKLRQSEPIVSTGEEYKGKYELNNKSAQQYIISSLRGSYTNADTGDVIQITRKGAEKVTRHDAESEAHLKSVALIPQMLENAIFISEEPNAKSSTGFDSYRYYVVGVKMGGIDYTAKLAIGVKDGQIYYDHALTEIEKGKLLEGIDPIKRGFANEEFEFMGKDKRLLSILQVNAQEIEAAKQQMREIVDEMKRRRGYTSGSEYQGSVAFNGAAPSKNAYYETKEARKEAFGNGDFEGEYSLGDFMDNALDGHDLQWQLENPRVASHGDKATMESLQNLRDVAKNRKRTIKMYRAVDADIEEGGFRNGDWVTPSREYAEQHIGLQNWKNGRIIEEEVSVDDIWWDGNDINEWGFDNGKDYAYRNTENNRKLNDLIVRDDNGKVIVPSRRFDKQVSDERFRDGEEDGSETPRDFLLNGDAVANVTGEKIVAKEGQSFVDAVEEMFASQGGKANSAFGEVLLDRKGVKNDVHHGMSAEKNAAFRSVKDVLENGVVILPLDNYGTGGKKTKTGVIAAPIMIDGERYVCAVEVVANTENNRLYVHEVFATKKLLGDVASNLVRVSNAESPHPQGAIAKLVYDAINPKHIVGKEDKTLMGVHNISEDKLRRAMKLGGLANPSLAVIDTSNGGHTDFGNISLIPRASLIDSNTGRNAGTYTGDAWTATYPYVEKHLTKQGEATISRIAKESAGGDAVLESHLTRALYDFANQNSGRLSVLYLLQKGEKPELVERNGRLDWYSTETAANNRIALEGMSEDYANWKEGLFGEGDFEEKLFAGYTPSGNRRYLDNTVENASRLMNKNSQTNSNNDGGLNATRSSLLTKMRSLAQIRKNKGLLQGKEAYSKSQEEMSDELFGIIKELSDMQKISDNRFMNVDYAEARLQEAITKRDPIGFLNREYGYNIPKESEYAKRVLDFIDKAKGMPVKYFETKFARPVGLEEFAIAVVPEGTSADVVEGLKRAGLDIRTYDGTEEGRKSVTMEAVSERDDILFRDSEELTAEYGDRWLTEQTNEDGRHTTQVRNTIKSYEKFGEFVKQDSAGREVSVLDASSGLGHGTEWMRENGMQVDDVEPYPSANRTAPTYKSYDEIEKKYDYIISNAVLNVIPDDWRADLLHKMADKLKVGGKMVINVRSAESIKNQGKEGVTKITLDSPSEVLVLRPDGSIRAYQKGFTKEELKEWCEQELGEGYSVEIANKKNAGGTYDTAVVVTKNNESTTKGSTSELGQPTASGAPVAKFDANVADKSERDKRLGNLSAKISENGALGSHELLHEINMSLDTTISEADGRQVSTEKSKYYDLGNGVSLRIADHQGNADTFARVNHTEDNYGIVIKLSPSRFKEKDGVDYVEYVYYPDKLTDAERQKEIVDGLRGFVETGDFNMLPKPDKVNTSGRFQTDVATAEAKRDGGELFKDSERRARKKATNDMIEKAMSFVSGKDRATIRRERQEREARRRAEARDLFERVLSGNFDEVTLQQIEKYVNEVTPRNEFGRRLSERLPQRVERALYERARENALDALFSRISESAVRANERTRPSGRRAVEEKKKELLAQWAKATGNWHTELSEFTDHNEPIGSGTDSDVYLSKDGNYVIKLSKGKPEGKRFRPDIDNVALFNYVFPNSKYRILGYGDFGKGFVRILEQPAVDFSKSSPLSPAERVAYMEQLGFHPINEEKTAFSNGSIVVADLQKSNIVKDAAGNISVIDADVKLHTKDIGGRYEYPKVEDELGIKRDGVKADLAETDKRTIAEEAQREAAELGEEVDIIEDVEELTHGNAEVQRRMRQSKGFFDVKSGRVKVVLPNAENVGDALKTIWHEYVGHKGLRGLFGEDFDTFLDNVFNNVHIGGKEWIYSYVAKEMARDRRKGLSKEQIEEKRRNGDYNRLATEEYMSHLAEDQKAFEAAKKSGVWNKIKGWLLDALRKAGIRLPKKLTDDDLRYILWRSAEAMKAKARGGEGLFAEEAMGEHIVRDAEVRKTLGLDGEQRYMMGDSPETFKERQQRAVENKGTVMPGLNEAEVKVVKVPSHPYTGNIKEATRQAINASKEKYAPNGEPRVLHYNNNGAEFDYSISGNAIEESLNPKQQAKSDNKGVHLAVAEHLDEVIGNSVEVEEHPDYQKNDNGLRDINKVSEEALMHRFYGAISVDGRDYRVMTLMREDTHAGSENGVHAYEVQKIEVLDEETPSTPNGVGSNESNNSSYPLAKLLRGVEKAYDKGKKILDESKDADIRFHERRFGGNSGYVGYSMSKRAAEARAEGRYPKTDFKKEYGLSERTLQGLVDAGIVSDSEWHHTSMYGNKTPFYSWEEGMQEAYEAHKAEVDALLKTTKEENERAVRIKELGRMFFEDSNRSHEELSEILREKEALEAEARADAKKRSKRVRELLEGNTTDARDIAIDDRAAQREYLLSENYVSSLTGEEFAKSDKPLTERVALFYAEKYDGKVERNGVGTILLDERSVKDSISHGIGRNKAVAFAAVPEIIKDGVIIDRQENWKGRGYGSVTFAAPVEIAGEGYVGVVIAKELLDPKSGTHRFYLHEVALQKNLLSEEFKTGMDTGSKQGDVANVLREIVNANTGAEKVRLQKVDADGELHFRDGEDNDTGKYVAPELSDDERKAVEECVEKTIVGGRAYLAEKLVEMSKRNGEDYGAMNVAMRNISSAWKDLRKAMSLQKGYDKATVKALTDLAKVMVRQDMLIDTSKSETLRLLGAIENVVGKADYVMGTGKAVRGFSQAVDRLMDLMLDNHLRRSQGLLDKLLKVRGSKVDARGVRVQGQLDVEGQMMMKALKDGIAMPEAELDSRLADCEERMSSEDEVVARNARIEYDGLLLAKQHQDEIESSKAEERELGKAVRDAKDASHETVRLEKANEAFNDALETLTEDNADSVVLSLGYPSEILKSAGVSPKVMKLYGNKVIKKMKKHGFGLQELKDLPRAVANPIAVFDNYDEEGSRAILTELRTSQGNFLVTITMGKGQDIDFNIVSSVFGKGKENIADWINNGYATYINKEKALNYLHFSESSISEAAENPALNSATKVVEGFVNPKRNGKILSADALREFEQEVKAQLMDNRLERIDAYERLTTEIAGRMGQSAGRAAAFREAEKERVGRIHHMANSDLQKVPLSEHEPTADSWHNKVASRILFQPLATFDELMRFCFNSLNIFYV